MYLRVHDLVVKNQVPIVYPTSNIKEVIVEISEKRLGATAVIDNHRIIGIITDGDIRRMLKNCDDFTVLTAQDIMSKNPKTIDIDAMAIEALDTMETHHISQILITKNDTYVGVVHLHDIIKEGIFR